MAHHHLLSGKIVVIQYLVFELNSAGLLMSLGFVIRGYPRTLLKMSLRFYVKKCVGLFKEFLEYVD